MECYGHKIDTLVRRIWKSHDPDVFTPDVGALSDAEFFELTARLRKRAKRVARRRHM